MSKLIIEENRLSDKEKETLLEKLYDKTTSMYMKENEEVELQIDGYYINTKLVRGEDNILHYIYEVIN